tara:strand:+ start:109 stop:585 length:477 start_codon:yes stop_codon:yes gene_type:complete
MKTTYQNFIDQLDKGIEDTIKELYYDDGIDEDYHKDVYTTFLDDAFQLEFDAVVQERWNVIFGNNLENVNIHHYLMLQKEMIDEYGLDSEMISNYADDPNELFNIYALNQRGKFQQKNYLMKWRYGDYENQMIKVQSLIRMKQSRIATIRKLHLTGSL